jgi:DNA-binding CsgD family transcriptional regulator
MNPPKPQSPAAAREHVAALRERGGTYRAIAHAAGIAPMTVHGMATGHRHPTPGTTTALLAIASTLPRAQVDAGGTRLRLRALQVMGHSSARIARATGISDKTIRALLRCQARTVSPRLRDAITGVYDTWWDKRPPERTRSERAAATAARKRAIAGNWCAGAALDDDQLDTPGYRPAHGWKPARGTGTAPDIHRPTLTKSARPERIGRSGPPAGQRKDPAMTQQQHDPDRPPGTRPPAYVVELWVSDQLRDRNQRNGRSLAEALQPPEVAQRELGEPDLEAEP